MRDIKVRLEPIAESLKPKRIIVIKLKSRIYLVYKSVLLANSGKTQKIWQIEGDGKLTCHLPLFLETPRYREPLNSARSTPELLWRSFCLAAKTRASACRSTSLWRISFLASSCAFSPLPMAVRLFSSCCGNQRGRSNKPNEHKQQ